MAPQPLVFPPQYRSFFTDAQAEELIAQFQLSDGDGSGAIDEREFHELLTNTLHLDVSPAEASDLVARIDVDGNGLVDFQELVGMVVQIKQGDTAFQKLRAFVDALDATPVALLEREATKFQMRVQFQLLDEKPGTKSTPPMYVMALTLESKWITKDKGKLTLQAIGTTTREAKFKAAHDGLLRIKQLKPGLAFEIGEVPDTWQSWLFENLEAGSSAASVLRKLREKGFSPAQNLVLMQRISTRVSSLRLRRKRGATRRSRRSGTTSSKNEAAKTLPIYDEQTASRDDQPTDDHNNRTDHSDDDTVSVASGPTNITATTTARQRAHAQLIPEKRRNGLHPLWVHWSQQELARGIDGRIVLDELVAMGFEPHKFPFVAQSFLKCSYLDTPSVANNATQSQPQSQPQPLTLTPRSSKQQQQQRRPSAERSSSPSIASSSGAAQSSMAVRPYGFWRCLEDAELREVELFVFGGQELNVAQLDTSTKLEMTPLQLVCKAGHVELASLLLENGAQVDQRDASHRTPLLLAAREGHTATCKLLLSKGASLLATDALDNTPLHCAAFSGSTSTAHLILETFDEQLLVFLAQVPQKRATSYSQILRNAHSQVMHDKLRENERRQFHKTWCWDALLVVYKALFGDGKPEMVPFPKFALLEHILERYHGRFLKQRQHELLHDSDDSDDEGEQEQEQDQEKDGQRWDAGVRERKNAERAARREWIAFEEMAFCVDVCLRGSYQNAVNKQGRTPLHVACEQNLVCTHELVVQCLTETHGCDPEIRDHGGCTPMELLLVRKARPGSPRGDNAHEQSILTQRRVRIDAQDHARELRRLEMKRTRWREALDSLSRDFQDLEVLELAKKRVQSSSPLVVDGWEIYQEAWSRNRLFVNAASGFVQRHVPTKIVSFTAQRLAWKEKLDLQSRFVEQNCELPEWEIHRVNGSDVYFFFNRTTTACQWLPPTEIPLKTWTTKRIFAEQSHFDDCEDAEALKLVFSGTFTAPLRNDCVRGRKLSANWRECSLWDVLFYWNDATDLVSIDKPADVVTGEAIRYAQVRVRARSEEIEELRGGWRRWYDAQSALNFYFDDDSGECVLDVDADSTFLQRVHQRRRKRLQDEQLTTEERNKRREEHEWKQALQRARKREVQQKETAQKLEHEASRVEAQDQDHAEELLKLESSVTSEHYDESQGRPLSYVAARFEREKEIFLANQRLDSMVSLNPGAPRPRHEIDRAMEIAQDLDDQEREHARIEDRRGPGACANTDTGEQDTVEPLSVRERRRVARIVWKSLERVRRDLVPCRWGCAMWFPRLQSLAIHEKRECPRRRQVCRLGCGLVQEDHVWQKQIYDHEDPQIANCDARIVACPRVCGVFTPHVALQYHMSEQCVRRPIGDLRCRLGCGQVYTGGAHELLLLEQDRVAHEQDDCGLRKVECTWPQCRGMIQASDRNDHRRAHVIASGVLSFLTAEIHEYKVPKGIKQLKLQAWGAGGGSGHLKGQTTGKGGGGAFIEGVITVSPGETLFFAVGAGGNGGKYAKMAQNELCTVETHIGVAMGGAPGGGKGHSGNKESACGGGGGFTSVYRHSAFGIEYILIAGGGGGGGTCRNGRGGAGLKAPGLREGDDLRVGKPGGAQKGGDPGECDPYNPICRFSGTAGSSLQGGDGAEFGGGGGGGLFGGGGGAFAPGIVGGGGGGSSFVNQAAFEPKTLVVAGGHARDPGGVHRSPPRSVGTAYWDLVDGVVGEGGTGTVTRTQKGNHGGIRLAKPGFFKDLHHHI